MWYNDERCSGRWRQQETASGKRLERNKNNQTAITDAVKRVPHVVAPSSQRSAEIYKNTHTHTYTDTHICVHYWRRLRGARPAQSSEHDVPNSHTAAHRSILQEKQVVELVEPHGFASVCVCVALHIHTHTDTQSLYKYYYAHLPTYAAILHQQTVDFVCTICRTNGTHRSRCVCVCVCVLWVTAHRTDRDRRSVFYAIRTHTCGRISQKAHAQRSVN